MSARFFSDNISESQAFLSLEDSKHLIKVLRLKVGDNVTICDKNKFDYDGVITHIDDLVTIDIKNKKINIAEPNINITLYQCLPKSDKFDFIIQKAVELGVSEIVPVQSKFCVVKNDAKSFEKKLVRYNKIAYEACKQSGRGIIPKISNLITYKQAVEILSCKNACICYESDLLFKRKRLCELINKDTTDISIVIGSEGGFSHDEIELAVNSNINLASLGNLILRCETAPITALSIILHLTENI